MKERVSERMRNIFIYMNDCWQRDTHGEERERNREWKRATEKQRVEESNREAERERAFNHNKEEYSEILKLFTITITDSV